jgi:diguanylate cyclase (GGDEF)-like protein
MARVRNQQPSDELYRVLFDALPVSLQVVDRDGFIVAVNPFHLEHMGRGNTKDSDYLGQRITERKSIVAAGLAEDYGKVLAGTPFARDEVYFPAVSGGGEGYSNILGVPLKHGDEIVGAVFISEDVTDFKRAKNTLHRANATLQAQMQELVAQADLREQAIRDPLTSLYNRRYLAETFDRELLRAERDHHQVALIMIDVDRFKHINDRFGHDTGDVVLKNLAGQLARQTRASDLVFRLGGDELLVVLLNATENGALKRAELYRKTFHESVLPGTKTRPTLSLGIALFPAMGRTSAEILAAADHALYQSKRQGRNRSTLFTPEPDPQITAEG